MLVVLTPTRLALFSVIKQKPGSIASIAQKMKRKWLNGADKSSLTLMARARLRRSAALHFHGQSYEFGREHEKNYGHRAGAEEPVELVSIQRVGQGLRPCTCHGIY